MSIIANLLSSIMELDSYVMYVYYVDNLVV